MPDFIATHYVPFQSFDVTPANGEVLNHPNTPATNGSTGVFNDDAHNNDDIWNFGDLVTHTGAGNPLFGDNGIFVGVINTPHGPCPILQDTLFPNSYYALCSSLDAATYIDENYDLTNSSGLNLTFTIDESQTFTECFAAGTMIATPAGEVAVETLKIGDMVTTAEGREVPVKWLGHQDVFAKFDVSGRNQPVRIRAGALGGGLPHSDLTVTADHGMIVDGLVINASALVNGTTIDFVPAAELEDYFTVYHVETEEHDVIVANGAAAETYLDASTRSHFDNHDEYLDLYGIERVIPEMDRPRISAARMLPQAIKDRLQGAPIEDVPVQDVAAVA